MMYEAMVMWEWSGDVGAVVMWVQWRCVGAVVIGMMGGMMVQC